MKNQRELFQALVDGEILVHCNGLKVHLNDKGKISHTGGSPVYLNLDEPSDWSIYKDNEAFEED